MRAEDVPGVRRRLAEAEVDRAQLAEARELLERGERELARIPTLEAELEHERRRLEEAHVDAERANRALDAVQASASWRMTQPLRAIKRRLR